MPQPNPDPSTRRSVTVVSGYLGAREMDRLKHTLANRVGDKLLEYRFGCTCRAPRKDRPAKVAGPGGS